MKNRRRSKTQPKAESSPNAWPVMAIPKPEPKAEKGGCSLFPVLLVLALLAFLIVLLMILGVIPLPFEKQLSPPPTATEVIQPTLPSATVAPSLTPLPALQPSATPLPSSTSTTVPTASPTALPSPSPSAMPFVIRDNNAFPNSLLYPQYRCEQYLFIGGEVWDLRESPLVGYEVRLSGAYGGKALDLSSLSGDAVLFGKSGYRFALDNLQIQEDQVYIQLFSAEGESLSEKTRLTISPLCEKNLIIINFKQVRRNPAN